MTSIQPPSLETERLLLRPMQTDDVDALLPIFSDPRVMASFGGVLFDRAQMAWWVQRNLDHQRRYGYGLFSVILKDSGLLIGDCGLERMDVLGRVETELGYDFRSDYWGLGLATEAASAVRDFAFDTLKLHRIICLIRQGNQGSRRVAERIGMTLSDEMVRDGRVYWVYTLSRGGRGV